MSHNTAMEITQISAVLNTIQSQVTGKTTIAPTNVSEFVSCAQTTLKAGYDPVINAVSQILGRTIFSIRPYTSKFGGLEMNQDRFGNHTRKLQIVDKPAVNDDRYALTDGGTVDPFIIRKPEVIQTNFYSQSVYENYTTVFRDQLDVAFSGPEEFQQFISLQMTNRSDLLEQWREDLGRMTLVNLIGSVIQAGKDSQKVKLVTEWNDVTGNEDTWVTIQADREKYTDFVKWMCGRIKTLASYMTNRGCLYHQDIKDKTIMRHTPYDRMKCYLMTSEINQIESNVFSSIFSPEFLTLIDHQNIDYWQAADTPYGIDATVSYMGTDGGAATHAVTASNILGVIFDEDAAGYSITNSWSAPSPFNPRGGYYSIFDHVNAKSFTDLSENAVVLILE